MVSSLVLGQHTVTEDRVRQVLEQETFKGGSTPGLVPAPLMLRDGIKHERYSSGLNYYESSEQQRRAQNICRSFREQAMLVEQHWDRLDEKFSELLEFNFLKEQAAQSEQTIIGAACHLLSRLPAVPVPSSASAREFDGQGLAPGYYIDPEDWAQDQDSRTDICEWENLQAVRGVSRNVIRLALSVIVDPYYLVAHEFADVLVMLMEAVSEDMRKIVKTSEHQALLVVHAFFWTNWQRTVMIIFWSQTRLAIMNGFSYPDRQTLSQGRRPSFLKNHQKSEPQLLPTYMCPWAFELLRSDRACVTQDFRRLHDRFSAAFSDRPPRCLNDEDSPSRTSSCSGTSPEDCGRFKGGKVTDQSQHDSFCVSRHCTQLKWDEDSYLSIDGSRAVCIETTTTHIRYRAVSDRTLAISHVWSHGQGSRPNLGFNTCLHNRYAKIARELGCDSYWMDAPCIPEDHMLRKEAIANINPTFVKSRATLVCDRDLADIDISKISLELQETILAVLIVSDWNVRAWTLLEAMRGRRNLYILAKHNQIISLRATLDAVVRDGCIDLVSLFIATQHLLPYTGQDLSVIDDPTDNNETGALSLARKRNIKGYVDVEEAACLLIHRHASRDLDDVVIWSLLNSNQPAYNASEFWKSRVRDKISTGFLMSDSPRVKGCRGFGWAPVSPGVRNASLENKMRGPGREGGVKSFPAFDGEGSVSVAIEENGLRAAWLICKFRRSEALRWSTIAKGRLPTESRKDQVRKRWPVASSFRGSKERKITEIAGVRVRSGIFDEISRDVKSKSESYFTSSRNYPLIQHYFDRQENCKYLALLHPLRGSVGYSLPPTPAEYRGAAEGPIFAVVGSRDGEGWQWIEIIEWTTQEWGVVPVMEAEVVHLI